MNDLSATERCVKCGLCLPHCPTFRLTGNEADSPRGRISLMQMLEEPDSDWSPGLYRHLDQCLMCHACESMCPSKVPFGALMDTARQRLAEHRKQGQAQRLMDAAGLALLTSAGGRKVAAAGMAMARLFKLQRLTAAPAPLRRLLELLPEPAPRITAADRPVISTTRGNVNLFTGCTGELLDRPTLEAVELLLTRLGYSITRPRRQTCCGALHQHSGQAHRASRLAHANLNAFAGNDDPVLVFASGCCAHLQTYAGLYPDAQDFGRRVTDIVSFLATHRPDSLAFKPLPEDVAVYIPCTQRNVLGAKPLHEVLTWIPEMRTTLINPDGGCCGAAGSYMLSQPQMSARLRRAMVERIADSGSRILVTTNIGCSLQLGAGLKQLGLAVEIMHPAKLLAAQLQDQPDYFCTTKGTCSR